MTYPPNYYNPLIEIFIVLQKTFCFKKIDENIESTNKFVSPGDIYEGFIIFRNKYYYIDLGYDKILRYNVLIPIFINNVDNYFDYNNKNKIKKNKI